MKKQSTTYRLFALLTAAIMAVSIGLPSALLAMSHCDVDAQQMPTTSTSGEHCPMLTDHSTHNHGEAENSKDDSRHSNCDWNFSCDCSFGQPQLNADAISSINKTVKAAIASITHYIDTNPTETPSFIADRDVNPHTENPPLFLLNSVFLN
jgi:hypothetical protein